MAEVEDHGGTAKETEMVGVPVFASNVSDAAARGREFGTAWRPRVEAAYAGYQALFHAVGVSDQQVQDSGARALDQLGEWAPRLAAEITGLADGAALEAWQVAAVNTRTEVLAAARIAGPTECSTAVVLPDDGGGPRTIQTWDWNETLRDVPVVWTYHPRPDHEVRGFTEFGVLGKIGLNSAGLGVHFNILWHASDHSGIGVPVHAVARRILDEATTIDEAIEIARSARLSASSVVTVVTYRDGLGDVAGLELSPAGVGVVRAADGFYAHTNHFLAPELSGGERLGLERPGTYDRLRHLQDRRDELASPGVMERASAMLGHSADGQAPVCCHAAPDEPLPTRSVTLATVSLDVAARRMAVHRGGPCDITPDTWQTI
ncbi:C45 family autoproteolytic acyltransferase/hydolase [Phytoactinopolyspora limicola]|uniref:C45 family autoproteolytic acyltransferase/hydolase n=1 Tax=Phytoactinopolyspora limicola TaxID=2715536 RepID=UPI001A9CB85A|nr:C45 family peptidase [Phytoactinopolyspora limicola]